jgi:hypothetical protein
MLARQPVAIDANHHVARQLDAIGFALELDSTRAEIESIRGPRVFRLRIGGLAGRLFGACSAREQHGAQEQALWQRAAVELHRPQTHEITPGSGAWD